MDNLVKEKLVSEQYLGSDSYCVSVLKVMKELINACDEHSKDGYSNFEITFSHDDSGYNGTYEFYYELYGYRQETEKEKTKRLQKEAKKLEDMKKKEQEERALFEELKKKYGNQ